MGIFAKMAPWMSWGVTTIFVLLQFFLQACAGLMAADWQKDFNLTPTTLGYLTASFYFAYVLMQIPVGLAFDKFGARRILCLASVFFCVGIVWLGLSHHFNEALIARTIMGIASSFGFIGMLYITGTFFIPKRFALLIGIAETLAMLGVAGAEILMAFVISQYGWRVMMLVSGSVMSLIAAFIIIFLRDPLPVAPVDNSYFSLKRALKETISCRIIWMAGLYGFAMFSIVNVVVALWGIPFLSAQYPDLSLNVCAVIMSLVFIGIAVGAPFNGWLSTYINDRRLIMIVFAGFTALFFSIVLYVPHLSVTALMALLFTIGFFSSSYIQAFAIVKEYANKNIQATALAMTNMLLMASAPLMQPLIGWILEQGYSYPQSLTLLEGILIGAFLGAFFFTQDSTKEKEAFVLSGSND